MRAGPRLKAVSWLPLPLYFITTPGARGEWEQPSLLKATPMMAKTCHLCFLILSHTALLWVY